MYMKRSNDNMRSVKICRWTEHQGQGRLILTAANTLHGKDESRSTATQQNSEVTWQQHVKGKNTWPFSRGVDCK